eukprot:CAMPEP_0117446046 /NCGR_PEP_ID=MMETSP0759-20121206/6124_1 /TAXON_ID=63605 /ORGANISM="Percolomonas cosmopolitus, Strain WS" /LENGTH=441 /DNA_ID=CAMNT_0005238271 /DNA_START=234 /DNA_END=1556 /DNA_ORIENTATION=+
MVKQNRNLNQKEAVKAEIANYFTKRVQEAGGNAKVVPPLSANHIRDVVVPEVRKNITVSYSFTPKLIYRWARETSEEKFNGNIQVTYSGSHYQSKKKASKGKKECKSPASDDENASTTSRGSTTEHHETLLLNEKLIQQIRTMNETFTEERLQLLAQISNQNAERMSLVNTISQLTKEVTYLRKMNSMDGGALPQAEATPEARSTHEYPFDSNDDTSENRATKKRKRNPSVDSFSSLDARSPTSYRSHKEHSKFTIEYISPGCGYINHNFLVQLKVAGFTARDRWIALIQSKTSPQQMGFTSVRQIPIEYASEEGIIVLPLGMYTEACVLSIKLYNDTRSKETNEMTFIVYDPQMMASSGQCTSETQEKVGFQIAADPSMMGSTQIGSFGSTGGGNVGAANFFHKSTLEVDVTQFSHDDTDSLNSPSNLSSLFTQNSFSEW